MKKKLTKREALWICLLMWWWLFLHRSRCKLEYPRYSEFGINNMSGNCPCCDYDGENNCSKCPIRHNYKFNYCLDGLWDTWKEARSPWCDIAAVRIAVSATGEWLLTFLPGGNR